ncbi:MAG: ribonuclease P protein component [Bacilli bacterium]|nr:ribonuclease P protein component [Bacilli bacterium]
MKKINVVRENREFTRIIQKNKPFRYKDYVIYIDKRGPSVYKFGLSVGKKVGNAVVRNKIKRQLRSILDKNDYKNNFDCIIIVGRGILKRSFLEMQDNLNFALKKLDVMKERENA